MGDGTIVEHTDIDVELVVDHRGDDDEAITVCMLDGLPDRVPDVSDIPDEFDAVHPEFEMIPTKERVDSVIKKVDNCVFSSPITETRTQSTTHAPLDTDGLEIIV